MRKEVARDLLPLVNNVDNYNRLQDYVKAEIVLTKDQLAIATTWEQVKVLQGVYQTLVSFSQLRERVEQDKQDK